MPRVLARPVRIVVIAVLAYLAVGAAFEIAWHSFPPSPHSDIPAPWNSFDAFIAWFALFIPLWPFSVAEFVDHGATIAVALFIGMFVVMYGTVAFVTRRRDRGSVPA